MRTAELVQTRRDRVVASAVVLLLLVPALLLLAGPKPARFGFQMYSGYGMTTASWTDKSGAVHDLRLADAVASARVEVDWVAILPELLCDRLEAAVRVEVRRTATGGPEERSVAC